MLEPEGVPEEYQPKRPQNQIGATHIKSLGRARINWWRRRESNLNGDSEPLDTSHTDSGHNPHNSAHSSELCAARSQGEEHNPNTSEHKKGRSVHSKGVPAEHRIPDDLGLVIVSWEGLPDDVRSAILAMGGSVKERDLLKDDPAPLEE